MLLTEQGHDTRPFSICDSKDTDRGWWCHLAVTMVMMCRSQLSMEGQIHITRRGASGLAQLGLVSDLASKQSSGHGSLGPAREA